MCVSHNHPANPGKEAVELGVDYALFVFHRKMWSSFLCFSACFGRFNGANDCVSPTLKPTESADIFKAWMTPTVSGFEGLFGFTWSLFFCFCYCYLTAPLNVPAEAGLDGRRAALKDLLNLIPAWWSSSILVPPPSSQERARQGSLTHLLPHPSSPPSIFLSCSLFSFVLPACRHTPRLYRAPPSPRRSPSLP